MDIMCVIPTYNEAQNIKKVVQEIIELPLPVKVMVVDDFSPDELARSTTGNAPVVPDMKPETVAIVSTHEPGIPGRKKKAKKKRAKKSDGKKAGNKRTSVKKAGKKKKKKSS